MNEFSTVGIVTRTKNRPMLLRRAIESVLAQTYPHWEMVVVNDGGDRGDVEFLVKHYSAQAKGRIRIIHNPVSLGMEGASKAGLDALDTGYLIFHDDDDSWAPEFLSIAVHELLAVQQKFPNTEGVTTRAHVVLETVKGNLVEFHSMEPFHAWIPMGFLSLDRMLAGNFVPPICFLFTKKAYDSAGRVYEPIPYLGDWDFFIRVLCRFDVYMIPQYLAFYHWRSSGEAGGLGNSITAELDRHLLYRQFLLNAWLRDDLASGKVGIGTYANLRRHIETLLVQTGPQSRANEGNPSHPPDPPAPQAAPAIFSPLPASLSGSPKAHVQLFYSQDGNHDESRSVIVPFSENTWGRASFPLPLGAGNWILRFDPINFPGIAEISTIEIQRDEQTACEPVALNALTQGGDSIIVTTSPALTLISFGPDPILILPALVVEEPGAVRINIWLRWERLDTGLKRVVGIIDRERAARAAAQAAAAEKARTDAQAKAAFEAEWQERLRERSIAEAQAKAAFEERLRERSIAEAHAKAAFEERLREGSIAEARLSDSLEKARQRIAALEESLSWKLTAPLRRLVQLFVR